MRTYLKIQLLFSSGFQEVRERVAALCEKVQETDDEIHCYPASGNFIAVIHLLNNQKIEYEIATDKPHDL
jgi:hypothetical protein